jgi:thiol-disulfide isomerase/thioredoxin
MAAKIIDVLRQCLKPYLNYILIAVLLIIFSVTGYYAYNRFVKPIVKQTKFKDVANVNKRSREANIFFFNVDWCPHCVTAKPTWKEFSDEYNGKMVGDHKLICHDIDCTDDNEHLTGLKYDKVANIVAAYNVESYPTVKLTIDGGDTIEFDSKISKKGLETFVQTVLNE